MYRIYGMETRDASEYDKIVSQLPFNWLTNCRWDHQMRLGLIDVFVPLKGFTRFMRRNGWRIEELGLLPLGR